VNENGQVFRARTGCVPVLYRGQMISCDPSCSLTAKTTIIKHVATHLFNHDSYSTVPTVHLLIVIAGDPKEY
jgi:hypothetical protein